MKILQLTKGQYTMVDDEDYGRLWKMGPWRCDNGYVVKKSSHNKIRMHRELMGLKFKDGKKVDHIDGNPLNNQKHNLRIVTHAQNMQNSSSRDNSTSKYKGVHYNKKRNKWRMQIKKDNKIIYSKRFNTELDAAKAYNEAAKELHGEYARLNRIS